MKKENLKIQQILSLAIENHKKNNFELAESLYNKILKIDANQFQTLFLLGSLYLQTKNFTDAIKLLEKAIKIKPNHADSYHNLGFASIELGEFQKAILLLNKTIEINPKHVDAYYNIANAYKQLRNFDDAKANFKEAIKLKPDNAKAYNNLGNVLKESGKTKEAIVSYKKAIQIQPNHAKAYHNLGNTFKQLGEIKNAAASYEKSFKYLPSNLEALDALSTLKEEILDIKLKKKINEIMKNKNITKKDIAYGNFLLSKFALKERNFEQEFDYLIKGHSHYFEYKRKIFEKGIDYWLNQLPNINALMEMGKIIKKNNDEIKPIFIVGIPRCGSTLIEKILASGSKEIPIGEETAILNFLVGEEITKKLKSNFDIKYMERVIIDSYKQKGLIKQNHDNVFTDKTLDNFFFIGLIKEIFPSAKIINCRRKPIASIMSILKKSFPQKA